MFSDLNESNFLLFAAKFYDNPHCSGIDEFNEDLHHIKYIKRLFRRYRDSKNFEILRIRLVLNHLIVLYNVFGTEAATRILFLKIEPDLWYILKTFLIFLERMPDIVVGISAKNIISVDIPIDMRIAQELRKL